jgi:hypothetical protein
LWTEEINGCPMTSPLKIRNYSAYIVSVFCFTSSAHADSLCKSDETLYFSCKVNNSEKMISLCGRYPPKIFDFDAPDYDTVVSHQAFLTYRFGTNQKIELEYPQMRTDSLAKFEGVSLHSMFGGGGAKRSTFGVVNMCTRYLPPEAK